MDIPVFGRVVEVQVEELHFFLIIDSHVRNFGPRGSTERVHLLYGKLKMGKVAETIKEIQLREHLALPDLFEKYPHLVQLQYEEQLEEQKTIKESKKQLLKG